MAATPTVSAPLWESTMIHSHILAEECDTRIDLLRYTIATGFYILNVQVQNHSALRIVE
jgi:hypothetical protein